MKDFTETIENNPVFLFVDISRASQAHIADRDLARTVVIGVMEKTDIKIVLLSVLLHDTGRLYPELGNNHYLVGARKASEYLMEAGFTSEEISRIIRYIKAHGPRGVEEPKTIEAKVVYDVDVLSYSDEVRSVKNLMMFVLF